MTGNDKKPTINRRRENHENVNGKQNPHWKETVAISRNSLKRTRKKK